MTSNVHWLSTFNSVSLPMIPTFASDWVPVTPNRHDHPKTNRVNKMLIIGHQFLYVYTFIRLYVDHPNSNNSLVILGGPYSRSHLKVLYKCPKQYFETKVFAFVFSNFISGWYNFLTRQIGSLKEKIKGLWKKIMGSINILIDGRLHLAT